MESTPEFFRGGAGAGAGTGTGTGTGSFHYNSPFNNNSERRYSDTMKNCDHFIVDELLDYPNDDVMVSENFCGTAIVDTTTTVTGGTSTDTSVVTMVDTSCNSSYAGSTPEPSSSYFPVVGGGDMGCRNYTDGQFSTELCVPYDDMAELEWLSNFVEESFSSEDLQKMQLISGMKAQTHNISQNHQFQPEPNRAISGTIYRPEMSVPAKARSKRSRAPTCNWTSRLLAASQTSSITDATTIVNPAMSSSSESDVVGKKAPQKKKETYENGSNGEGRKCFHCATVKTPQWRTGPMGPKTLCNACGVRYKSGRLVPEYRPAASPTFMLTKHSNSHRKVIELRRQNEFFRAQQQQQQQQFLHDNMMFDVSNGDDFLIHHHLGTDYRQII